jgi:hypothetical protein
MAAVELPEGALVAVLENRLGQFPIGGHTESVHGVISAD